MNIRTIALYLTSGIVILAIGGLAGWYLFLQKQKVTQARMDTARGFGQETPSFTGSGGSTQNNLESSFTSTANQTTQDNNSGSSPVPTLLTLREISSTPVAGFGFAGTATSTYIVYIERGSGHILRTGVSSSSVERISNTLVSHVYTAQVAEDGSIVEQTVASDGTLNTNAIPANTTASTTNASVGGQSASVILNTHTRSLLYLSQNTQGGVDGLVASWPYSPAKKQSKKQGGSRRVFSSFISQWNIYYMPDSRIIMSQRAADNVPGFAYALSSDGSFIPLVWDAPGLTIVPHPILDALAYSSSSNGTLSFFVQSNKKAAPQKIAINTVADKCVWLSSKSLILYCAVPSNISTTSFLNDWYRGAVHTDDNWWIIDGVAGTAKQIYSPRINDAVSVDVIDPKIDASGNYISFKNNTDQSLWLFKIPQQ